MSVASAVTINKETVDDKENSFLVHSDEEWEVIFKKILPDKIDFQDMGSKAYENITWVFTTN